MHRSLLGLAGVALLAPALFAAEPCESLATLALPQATIDSAQVVAAGEFLPPNMRARDASDPARVDNARGTNDRNAVYKTVPAFCRVTMTLRPSSDSDIKVELRLPAAGWNKKYQAVGNGGWAGVISYGALPDGVKRG